jgi:hypothetical protein
MCANKGDDKWGMTADNPRRIQERTQKKDAFLGTRERMNVYQRFGVVEQWLDNVWTDQDSEMMLNSSNVWALVCSFITIGCYLFCLGTLETLISRTG